ncbi:hypothetical protein DL766_000649 [Monosporascus sp. MC13-8B]|nr:hypothetical protein DL766_000649 [Monosporascus sp. MC13-8B]
MPSWKFTTTTLALLAGLPAANAHSWVEALKRIGSNGAFSQDTGYPIGFIQRGGPGFSDDSQLNKILDTKPNPPVCKPSAGAYQGYDRLAAGPGDFVAMLYQENGHVTDPTLTPRPYRGGNVYVYGTLQHHDATGINDVLGAWTADGKGGDGKGRLLAAHYFDDGVCYQNRGGPGAATNLPIYTERVNKYGLDDISCQTDFQLPADLPAGGKYTVMWVWDWPLITSDTANVTEIYTSCAEIDLRAPAGGRAGNIKFTGGDRDAQNAAIRSQLETPIEATALGVGTSSPAPVKATPKPDGGDGPSTGAPAAPPPPPAPSSPETTAPPTSSLTRTGKGGSGSGTKTVTVTQGPQTTTQVQTVTVSDDGSTLKTSVRPSSSAQATPTSQATVSTVEPFLKARVTGAARRQAAFPA